jgi:DNA-binding transcriptional MocR family regulator
MAVHIHTTSVVDLLGPWAAGADPLYEQLAGALRRLIDAGDLPAGARIPSERELSAALGVSRTTVVTAYDQLRATGFLRSRRGSGTRVARRDVDRLDVGRFDPENGPHLGAPHLDTSRSAPFGSGGAIELTIGALPGAELIAEETARVARDELPALLRNFGYLPTGLPALREAIATHLGELGLPTTFDQVIVTSGCQQAIDLIARQLCGPDGSVIIENPTYPGAIDAFRAAGSRLIPVPVDRDGAAVDLIRLHAERRPAQLAYLVPTFQNPTGTVMASERRRAVAELADEVGLRVVEDLTPMYLTLGEVPPAPIATHDVGDRVITLGSLSKVAWGGLRIGWIRGARAVIQRIAPAKAELDYGSSLLSQAVAVRLFSRLDELAADAQAQTAQHLEVIETALRQRLPDWTWARPAGGPCLWVRLPAGDAMAFAQVAAEFGVIVRPGPALSVDGSFRDRIRLAFGHDPATLREAVDRLAAAWAAFEPTAHAPRPELTISI